MRQGPPRRRLSVSTGPTPTPLLEGVRRSPKRLSNCVVITTTTSSPKPKRRGPTPASGSPAHRCRSAATPSAPPAARKPSALAEPESCPRWRGKVRQSLHAEALHGTRARLSRSSSLWARAQARPGRVLTDMEPSSMNEYWTMRRLHPLAMSCAVRAARYGVDGSNWGN